VAEALREEELDAAETNLSDDAPDDALASQGAPEKYPHFADMQGMGFAHPPTTTGGYGDLQRPETWRHYFGRHESAHAPMPGRKSEFGDATFAAFSTKPKATPPASSAAGLASPEASSSQAIELSLVPAPAVQQEKVQIRFACRDAGQQRRAAGQRVDPIAVDLGGVPDEMRMVLPEAARSALSADGGACGRLHLMQSSYERDWCTSAAGGGIRLKFFDPLACADSRLCMPILTPSRRPAALALLDRSLAIRSEDGEARDFCQIVLVPACELQSYQEAWPDLDFFSLPTWADHAGVGAARFCLKRLAERICPVEYPYCIALDDNVLAWKGITLPNDQAGLFPGYLPRQQDGATLCDQSLWSALSYLQDPEFTELRQFALLGFYRIGHRKYTKSLTAPFGRRHVYKAVLLNLERLRGREYDAAVWALEDLDLSKRLVCECFPPPHSNMHGRLCSPAAQAPPAKCASQPAGRDQEVLCKIYLLGFIEKNLPGGASGGREKRDSDEKPPPPTVDSVASLPNDELDSWLSSLDWPSAMSADDRRRIYESLVANQIELSTLRADDHVFDHSVLKDLGVDILGQRFALMKGIRALRTRA